MWLVMIGNPQWKLRNPAGSDNLGTISRESRNQQNATSNRMHMGLEPGEMVPAIPMLNDYFPMKIASLGV